LRSGQKRFIGFVMTGRHPCSPREVTLSALPAAAYRAGRDIFFDHSAREPSRPSARVRIGRGGAVGAPFEVLLHRASFETPERNTP
jgi:hypothetical protein